jgi:hypothetical protein
VGQGWIGQGDGNKNQKQTHRKILGKPTGFAWCRSTNLSACLSWNSRVD